MRSMRRGLFLTALVTLLCALSGCFWLEPVYGVTGPDGSVDAGDGGTDGGTDAGSDGGTDGGCGTEALPAAAELLPFVPAQRYQPLGDGSFTVRVALAAPLEVPVRLDLASNAPEIVRTVSEVCIPANAHEIDVTLEPLQLGEAIVTARLGTQSLQAMTVVVVGDQPVLQALHPARAFIVEDESIVVTAELSGPTWEDTQITLDARGLGVGTISVPQGAQEGSTNVSFATLADNELIELVGTMTTNAGTTSQTARLKAGHVVISEVLWSATGFVELYNPTSSDVDISGWRVTARPDGGGPGSTLTLTTFAAGTTLTSGGYRLLVADDAAQGDDFFASEPSNWSAWTTLEVRLRPPTNPEPDIDVIRFGLQDQHAVPTTQSAERIAWEGVTQAQMLDDASHGLLGNGWDTDHFLNDFILRTPDPQASGDPREQIQ